MCNQDKPAETPSEQSPTSGNDQNSLNKTFPRPKESEESAPPKYSEKEETPTVIPSHSPLAYSNYPPLWSPTTSTPTRLPKSSSPQQSKPQQYTSAESMRAILNTGSSSSSSKKEPDRRFEERDPSNQHQYLSGPDRRYTHPRLNVFGTDVMSPSGKGGWFGRSGKKKK